MSHSLVASALFALTLAAAPASAAVSDAEALQQYMAETYPQLAIDTIRPTPVDGIYEVVSGTNVLYLSADGRYLFHGSLLDLETQSDLTAERRGTLIHGALDALEEGMLIYEPAIGPAEHTITVFTDTSCPFCRRLHEEVLKIIAHYPVRVRYLMFPRAGLDSAAADAMRDVWCAPDPRKALTRAKRGQPVPARDADCETPIAKHYRTGLQIGVSGTPYLLVGESGPIVAGYRPADRLLKMLGIEPKAATQ